MSVRWRDVLKIHPAVELFPPLDPDEMRALGDDIRKHGLHEPVVVMRQYRRREGGTMDVREYDLVLIDGRNRLDAMEAVGFTLVRDGKLDPTLGHKALGLEPLTGVAYAELDDDVDVYAFVVSRNIHRRHLTAEKKRELIAKLIKATPEKSDLQIAETVKASPTTVGTVRAKMESSGDVSKLDTRQDTKGRKQPAKRARAPRSEKPPPPAPPPAPARADIEQGSAGERERKDARVQDRGPRKRDFGERVRDQEIARRERKTQGHRTCADSRRETPPHYREPQSRGQKEHGNDVSDCGRHSCAQTYETRRGMDRQIPQQAMTDMVLGWLRRRWR